jgi:hypothetical protein
MDRLMEFLLEFLSTPNTFLKDRGESKWI